MRNADLTIDEDEAEDLLKEIEKQVRRRQWGEVIRLEVEEGISPELLNILVHELNVEERDIYRINGPMDLAFLSKEDVVVGVNVCGHSREEYLEVVEALAGQERVDFLEINISCPNVKQGALAFGQDPKEVEAITKAIKEKAKVPVVMKLTPNVTSIAEIAKAAEAGGADGISLINTLTGMKVDVERQSFLLANKTGGMSGPAVHPIAVRMVYEAANAVSLPIIGMGGITTWQDAVEMMLVGATAVSVGTANFMNPTATVDIIEGIEDYLSRHGIASVKDIIGRVKE
jgi:dihydroorotate dehydrogenase (NAD+) catalytic subunit